MTTPDERDPLEWLATEFLERQRNGEAPSVAEYAQKYPDLAEEIRDLFPTILAMESCKQSPPTCPPASGDPVHPEWVGDYRIVAEIGRGGMGIVYEAEQPALGRRVALKVLPQHALLGEKALERFRREARSAARLHHTNIVPVFGVGDQNGLPFYVMQLIRGVSLDKVVRVLRGTARGKNLRNGSGGPLKDLGEREEGGSSSLSVHFSATWAAQALLRGSFSHSRPAAHSGETEGGKTESAPRIKSAAGGEALPQPEQPIVAGPDPRQQGAVDTAPLPPGELPVNGRSPRSANAPGLPPGSHSDDRYFKSIARMGTQVADALHHAHLQGTVHRDVKPGNLLLDERGVIWLTDFGLARDWDHEGLTRTGDIAGTLLYVAPEQLDGKPVHASDVYSLGATLYELLTLRPAFTDTQAAQVIRKIHDGDFPRPRTLCPDVPRDLETIVLKAMARDPGQRYRTAGELRDDLQRYLSDLPIQARRISLPERFWRWCRRNRAVAALSLTAGVAAVLAFAAVTFGYFHTRRANRQVQESLAEEKRQRGRAESSSKLAQQALDRIFLRFAQDRLPNTKGLTIQEGETEIEIVTPPVLAPEDAALLEELLGYYEDLAEQEGEDLFLRRKVADARRRVGDIRYRLGNPEGALTAYRGALRLYDSLRRHAPGDPQLLVEVAGIHNLIGNILGTIRRHDEQRGAHRMALALLETVPDAERGDRLLYELARTHHLLARLRFGRPTRGFRPRSRIDHQAEAIRILEDLQARSPSIPDYRFLLALCFREVPRDRFPPDVQTVLAAADKAATLLTALVEAHPGIPEYRHELVETHAILEVRWLVGREMLALAEARFLKALELSEPLVREHPNEPEFLVSRATVHSRLADTQRRLNRHDEAAENYREAVHLLERLTHRFPNASSYRFRLAFAQDARADVLMGLCRWQEARPLLEAAISRWEAARRGDPRSFISRGFLAGRYRRLVQILDELGEKEAAEAAREKAEDYARPLPRTGPGRGGRR